MDCCITNLNITCIKNQYIQIAGVTKPKETTLFNGLRITNGSRSYYIRSPYSVIRRGSNFHLTGSDGFELSFTVAQTVLNVDQIIEVLADCNCSCEETAVSQSSWEASGNEFEEPPVEVPEDVSGVLVFRNGIYVPTEAQGGDYWRRESATEIEFTPSGTIEAGEFLSIILL